MCCQPEWRSNEAAVVKANVGAVAPVSSVLWWQDGTATAELPPVTLMAAGWNAAAAAGVGTLVMTNLQTVWSGFGVEP